MKCPKCSANHKRSQGMRCGCGYQFVFDPKQDKMTDGRFTAALNKVSANDTYYFTQNQLDAVIRGARAKSLWRPGIICLVSLVGGLAMIALGGPEPLLWGLFVIFSIALLVWLVRQLLKPDHLDVASLVESWRRTNGPIEKLVSEPKLSRPPPEWQEPDIYDYGVERILFVERDILVDLLVKNGFHAEQRALVLSEHGYPSYIESRARTILKESPDTKVFLMHDSTPTGVGMKGRIIAKYGLEQNPPVDLGVFPDDWKKLKAAGPLGLRHDGYEAPVDMIPFSRLGTMTAAAFIAGVSFMELPDPGPSSSESSGGFG